MRQEYFRKLAKIAYDTYCGEVGWKSVRGEPLPQFNEQKEAIRNSWIASTTAVYNQVVKDWQIAESKEGQLDGPTLLP